MDLLITIFKEEGQCQSHEEPKEKERHGPLPPFTHRLNDLDFFVTQPSRDKTTYWAWGSDWLLFFLTPALPKKMLLFSLSVNSEIRMA